jgi:predicted glycosyltransferase involved in capsule biosynthesis
VIFDWGNGKESATDIIDQNPDSRIKLLVGLENLPFSMSISHNTAIRASKNDLIFFIDCDVKMLDITSLSQIKLQQNDFIQGCPFVGEREKNEIINHYRFLNKYLPGLYRISLSGTCMFWKEQFNKVNGYDERLEGWGYEDYDFYNRLALSGFTRLDFPENTALQHIHHDDEERVKNFTIKDCNITNKQNKELTKISLWDHQYQQRKMKVKIFYQNKEGIQII